MAKAKRSIPRSETYQQSEQRLARDEWDESATTSPYDFEPVTWAEAFDATEQPVSLHLCSQCQRDMGSEWILGPVCGKCCRANHARVTGQRVRTAHKATVRGMEG
jgi:hypothetical protein